MIEISPYPYFLPKRPKILIIGSFACYNGTDYGDWFYSGSGKNYFWKLLSDVFGMPATNRGEKEQLCEEHGIALTDIGKRIKRLEGNCSDTNLHILEYNTENLRLCLASGIKKIFFTSRFVEAGFIKLFPDHNYPTSLLPSPSPAANRHIGGLQEYKKMVSDGVINSPYQYRLLKYKQLFI